MVRFRVLGPLEITDSERVIPPLPGKQSVLLAALLLGANQVVSTGDLIDYLWDQDPPSSARRTLQLYVTRLRQALGPDVIRTRGGGYVVEASPETLDLLRFRHLLSQAQQAETAAKPAAVSARLGEALALWRRPVLADVASDPLQRGEIARLDEEWAQATEQRIETDLVLGRHRELVAELSGLVAEFPLREKLHTQLMLALYRSGRQADALQAYREVRHRLAEELGIEPGKELRDTQQAILAADPALEITPAARTPVVVPRQLPPAVAGFTGREPDLARLDALLARHTAAARNDNGTALVTAITGTAGVGKTALAVQWARSVAERFPDGQLWVDLRGYHPDQPLSPGHVLSVFLRALGVPGAEIPAELEAQIGLYRSLLEERRVLVVLDNAGSCEQVRPLLPGAPGCLTLITSRGGLGGLVARDGAVRIELGLLSEQDAKHLLHRLLDSALTDDDPAAVAELAALCARLPLALRVAAERIEAGSDRLREAAAELAALPVLDALAAGDDPNAATRTVLSWSYRALPADAATLFRRFGLVPGAQWDTYSAAALADCSYDEARRLLGVLARAHLIEEHGGRCRMHDLLRAYARELVAAEDAGAAGSAATTRLLDYYLDAAATAVDIVHQDGRPGASHFPDRDSAMAWLDAERYDLLAAVVYAAHQGWPRHAVRLAATLERDLVASARHPEALLIHRSAVHAAGVAGDVLEQATALHHVAMIEWLLGSNQGAFDDYQHALELYRDLGDRHGEARSLDDLGIIYLRWGRYDEAASHHQQALALYRELGDRRGQASSLNNLGNVHLQKGHYGKAFEHYRRALDINREIGSCLGEAHCLNGMGSVHQGRGEFRQASVLHQRSLDLHRRLGDRTGEANCLNSLGTVCMALGDYEPAIAHHELALAIRRESGDCTGQANSLNELGNVHLRLGHNNKAIHYHQNALGLRRRLGDRTGEVISLNELGNDYLRQGHTGKALRHCQTALDLVRETGQRAVEIHILNSLGEISHAKLLPHDALDYHRAAFDRACHIDHRPAQARALAGLSRAHNDLGDDTTAHREWHEARILYAELGMPEPASAVAAPTG